MLPNIRTVAFLFLFGVTFACQDDEEKIFGPIEGNWRGTLAELQVKPFGLPIPFRKEDESFASLMEFRTDGKLIVQQDGQPYEGTYQVIDDNLVIDIDLSVADVALSGKYTLEKLTDRELVFYKEESDKIADPDGGLSVSGKIKVTLHFERV